MIWIQHFTIAWLIVTLSSGAATACGICTLGLTWNLFPPVLSWSLLATGWFVSLAVLSEKENTRLILVPKITIAIVLGVAGVVLGFTFFGGIIMLPLLVPCFLNLGLSVFKIATPSWTGGFRWAVRLMGVVALAALSFFLVYDTRKAEEMDAADRIMMWEGSALSQKVFNELKEEEPASIEMYRKIIREHDGFYLWMTARQLQEIGEPEIDVPILIEAYRSPRSEDEYGMEREGIEEALRSLTGLDLPENTPAEEWERRWEEVSGSSPI